LLSVCATDDSIPVEQYYQAPSLDNVQVAHIRGSFIVESGVIAINHVGFVLMVDDKVEQNGPELWNRSLALSPGWHKITGEYRQSVFRPRADFKIEAQPGTSYELEIAPSDEGSEERPFCRISIVDAATGKPITAIKRCNVSGGENRG
jgi:hypothetical protein